MADFPTALNAALRGWYTVAGVKRPVGHRQGFTARLNALEKKHGSRKAAAAAAGIGASTWRAWFGEHKRAASAASTRKVEAAYDQLLRDRAAAKISTPRLMVITATVVGDPKKSRYVNKTPHRTFKADQLGQSGIQPIATAHLRGNSPDAVAAVAYAAIRAAYSTQFAFEGDNVTVELS